MVYHHGLALVKDAHYYELLPLIVDDMTIFTTVGIALQRASETLVDRWCSTVSPLGVCDHDNDWPYKDRVNTVTGQLENDYLGSGRLFGFYSNARLVI